MTRGVSLQAYLLEAMHAQAVHLRRRTASDRSAARLAQQPAVDEEDRAAVLKAIDDAQAVTPPRYSPATPASNVPLPQSAVP